MPKQTLKGSPEHNKDGPPFWRCWCQLHPSHSPRDGSLRSKAYNYDINRFDNLLLDTISPVHYNSRMEVVFDDASLDALETDAHARPRFPTGVIKSYRRRLWQIRAAHDERDFYANRGFHFEKYQEMEGHFPLRLNDQYRLIIRFEEHSEDKTVVIVGIRDYH